MDFKTAAITATAAGTILLSGLTFSGTINLADIKTLGWGWTEKLNTAVNETKDMAAKFGLFKTDVTELLNEKIAKINELNARISQLGVEVASGSVNLEDANNEIARLNEELTKANSEVEALKNEYALKDSEVQTVFAAMVTDESMDTTLALDTQNPDAVVEDTTPEAPEEPEAPENPYAAQEAAIKNDLSARYITLNELQVTMTSNTITITEPQLYAVDTWGNTLESYIEIETGLSLNQATKPSANTYQYTY